METTDNEWKLLLSIEHIVYSLNKENISQSAYLIFNNFDKFYPLSFNTVIYQMVNTLFTTKINNFDVYLEFLKEIETIEENNKCKPKNFINPQTPSYLLAKMIEQNLLDINNIQKKRNPYLIHYMTEKEIRTLMNLSIFQVIDELLDLFIFQIEENYEELSKNDWELHKQLIKEGVNPNEIAKIIRNDEIEKLQEISSQSNFDFNQTIEPSLYERCTFVNQEDVTIIDYAAFFSAVKCFKYLLINGAKVENTGKYAIAGGNEEIIHLCEQNHSTFCGAYETAIAFHRNDIFYIFMRIKLLKKLI